MKRFVPIVLAIAMLLSFAACTQKQTKEETNPKAEVSEFADVKTTDKCYKAIVFCRAHGFLSGQDGKFYPEQQVTRYQLACVMYRVAGSPATGDDDEVYSDVTKKDTSDFVIGAILWGAAHDVVPARSDDTYGKEDPMTFKDVADALKALGGTKDVVTPSDVVITRGELAQVLMDFCTK